MKTNPYHLPLEPENTYHIFSRAVGNEKLFRSAENYRYFLQKLKQYTLPVAEYYAFALIPNHFHLLVRIRPENELHKHYEDLKGTSIEEYQKPLSAFVMQCFSNFLNGYTKAYNKMYQRKGALFLDYIKRSIVQKESDFTNFVRYIHQNAVHHGLTQQPGQWQYDSYHALCSQVPTDLNREYVLNHFEGIENFIYCHNQILK